MSVSGLQETPKTAKLATIGMYGVSQGQWPRMTFERSRCNAKGQILVILVKGKCQILCLPKSCKISRNVVTEFWSFKECNFQRKSAFLSLFVFLMFLVYSFSDPNTFDDHLAILGQPWSRFSLDLTPLTNFGVPEFFFALIANFPPILRQCR